jgi:hypothetical protein
MVVSVLNNPVDSILLLVDRVSVFADNGAVLGNLVSHQLLIDAEVINLKSSLSIGLIVLHKVLIEDVSSVLKLSDL